MARSRPARAVAVAALAAVLAAGATGCGASPGDDKDPDHRTFALEGRSLTVDSDDSALEIVAADGNATGRVRVTRWFTGSVLVGSGPKVTWSLKDDRLVLRVHCSGFGADCAARHRVEVPRGVAVAVENGDGSVRARGFREALSIHTGDGSVHVTDTSGPLTLRTGDGSVHAEVASRDVRTRTGDGSVRVKLSAVPDRVEAVSGDGSVTLSLPRAAYRVSASSGDGRVRVSVPRDDSSPHRVSVHTGDGGITVHTAN
ncbi:MULTISPECIES: DUF4097 family beta strand repeat-containing protein [unclassified Streptomyces]|uniref:DUF4097 family beta strand repeat-containing protein n=1 Tax=unclassified Streptomyces TaxID=2593676 RepID=UPI001F047272|nr:MULTISPECIES: DUF4097 family beta strand repeat-containing protein [unclassified Streptomyces]MCH0565265.1 DUF4097 family beta strand repeat protein [Streptomyces sp. MUM 2J]MCH0568348.1 DUF4097 family beta strand repeat protein [Streptomyces sp. MUM 136J]